MERFFFKKIEVWFVALIVILLLLGTGFFGVVVRNATLGHDRFGVIGRIALAIAEVPANLSKLLNDENPMVAWENEAAAGKSGWQFSQLGNDFDSYILLSRYDAEAARQIIELIDVRSRKPVYVWRPDADTLLEGVPRTSIADHVQFENWNTNTFAISTRFFCRMAT